MIEPRPARNQTLPSPPLSGLRSPPPSPATPLISSIAITELLSQPSTAIAPSLAAPAFPHSSSARTSSLSRSISISLSTANAVVLLHVPSHTEPVPPSSPQPWRRTGSLSHQLITTTAINAAHDASLLLKLSRASLSISPLSLYLLLSFINILVIVVYLYLFTNIY